MPQILTFGAQTMAEEALENPTEEEAEMSGEAYLKVEEDQPEVVELPPNVQRLQEKQELLRQEIGNLTNQVNQLVAELETRQLAFNQCTALLEQEVQT